MERTPVTSTNILSVGYDPDQEILEIEFISGPGHPYSGVPDDVNDGILAADSKAKYFHSTVKNECAFVNLCYGALASQVAASASANRLSHASQNRVVVRRSGALRDDRVSLSVNRRRRLPRIVIYDP